MTTSNIKVCRFELYLIYSIDLGHLLTEADQILLQQLRANDSIYENIKSRLLNIKSDIDTFRPPKPEKGSIESMNQFTKTKGGKNIWSKIFLEKQAPLLFEGNSNQKLMPQDSNSSIVRAKIIDSENIEFSGCNFRIFREGTLSFRFCFSQKDSSHAIEVNNLIDIFNTLEERSTQAFYYHINKIIEEWRSLSKSSSNNFKLKESHEIKDLIETYKIKHSCIFIEKMFRTQNGSSTDISAIELMEMPHLLGILNNTKWYKKYYKRYIQEVFSKNIGYRDDEIYLTDKDSSLILLSAYWEKDNPLNEYRENLMLAFEMFIAKLAFLDYIHYYLQANPYQYGLRKNSLGDSAVKFVLQTRSILTLAQESIDINSFIIHGFTRRVIKQLSDERGITSYVDSIERRIENIHSAIQLNTSIHTGKLGISLNQKNVYWAIIAVFISALLLLVDLILTHGSNIMAFLSNLLLRLGS